MSCPSHNPNVQGATRKPSVPGGSWSVNLALNRQMSIFLRHLPTAESSPRVISG
ncbi:hypothetical protein H6F78_13230 [Coleofasciculus sp. FACHB-64]|uniref:hypothetical protein n=1 Tax=Cyanophyceae TaxID=3028117 RepID=UPI001685BE76|nr:MULTISPECIES: hypothetical protein [unclassified Coleofasciculus]MBD1839705.1 hypothetical protein [Coleofasciculus sp. FACHB-501]MBD1891159.1 hypothetical protein [Coleofasciculus sp. FACHB-SPT9]MBD1943104.1 hypothetical protein [Coleofasciculus sp. FACHB-712]MBD2046543.1 hypothetical protein [Coleofasciculus sp. FACHB-64]MBD2540249.1 hypothetical protein [Coleofasciculus sp. FACHB-SPT36]